MLINLNEAIQKAKENGATENPGVQIIIKLPTWIIFLGNLLNPKISVKYYYGEITPDGTIRFTSTWTTRNDTL